MAKENITDAYAGKELGSLKFEASDRMLSDYFLGLRLDKTIYEPGGIYSNSIVPSMILTNVDGGFSGSGFSDDFGNLWIRQQWELNSPIQLDQIYEKTSHIVDVYDWRDRRVVQQEVKLRSGNGDVIAKGVHHQSYLLGKRGTGNVKLRVPSEKGGARKFIIPQGESIGTLERKIDLEMCGTFFHGNENYHTSESAAHQLGFEKVVVGGRMTMSLIGALLDQRFGRAWFEGGQLDIKFVNIVWPGDTVTARGIITDRIEEADGTRVNLSVWLERLDGTPCIVGTASALEKN